MNHRDLTLLTDTIYVLAQSNNYFSLGKLFKLAYLFDVRHVRAIGHPALSVDYQLSLNTPVFNIPKEALSGVVFNGSVMSPNPDYVLQGLHFTPRMKRILHELSHQYQQKLPTEIDVINEDNGNMQKNIPTDKFTFNYVFSDNEEEIKSLYQERAHINFG